MVHKVTIIPRGATSGSPAQVIETIKLASDKGTKTVKGNDNLLHVDGGGVLPRDLNARVVTGALEQSNVNLTEALIDMIPVPVAPDRTAFEPHSGGAVFNTAIALGRLGLRTGMLTGLSLDLFGRQPDAALRASQVGGVSPARRARRSHSQRLQLALSLLRDARLDALIDGESDFADLPTTLARLSTAHRPGLCHRIRYP